MSEKTKRRWFQFHLSTALVVMLTAGVALALSLPERAYYWSAHDHLAEESIGTVRGWPLAFHIVRMQLAGDGEVFYIPCPSWNYSNLFIDIASTLAALVAVAILSEAIIRRREARKP